ncbi:trypsin-1-like [Pollicipes pollicipes]|uniref:trypsin-1-like n=1 Tax=Pollicipes pollicipes TaxID=41117 RepID=UPI0018852AA5|nr:trypsin-1-like [Pollicipes pollicipes]
MNLANVPCGRRLVAGRQTRVKGGQAAYHGQFPWSASVQHHGSHFCMGAVLNDDQFTVTVGGHNLTRPEASRHSVAIAERIVHDGYQEGKFDDDIALLRLATKVGAGDDAGAAAVGGEKFTGKSAIMAGWGYLDEWRRGGTRPDTLQWTEVPVLSRQTCQDWFTEAKKSIKISEGKICAGYKEGGKDSCQADSGGPLVVQVGKEYQVAGVVSAGIGCGRPNLPGIYTDLTVYAKWVVGQISARTSF